MRRLQDVLLVLLAVAVGALVYLALRHVSAGEAAGQGTQVGATQTGATGATPNRPADSDATSSGAGGGAQGDSETSTGDDESAQTSAPKAVSLRPAREALASGDPVTVSVLGDGTSNARQEWVHRWATALAESRPVTISHWDEAEEAGFVEPDVLSDSGDGSAVTIWSGSSSGATADYAAERIDEIVPQDPDLVLLNYGHGIDPDDVGDELDTTLEALTTTYGRMPVVVVLQNPLPDDADRDVREAVADWAASHDLPTIDVAAAFLAEPDYASLLGADGSPDDDGSTLWARTVEKALEPTG